MNEEAVNLLILGGISGMCISNTIQIAVLKYRFNHHLRACGKDELIDEG